ncbi:MAG: Cache 3/Cache 2 fusion domain-containing protein, partial [Firmicutes bacterium]|nr:Cache 3/Cache 2 fusion domain-containing protein [Bacillota bacterium]
MFNLIKNSKLTIKIAVLGVIGVLATSLALVFVVVWQSDIYNNLAQNEVDDLVDSDLNHITSGIYNMIKVADESTQTRINYNLNVASCILYNTGSISFSKEKVKWEAINQFSTEKETLYLPKLLIGGRWVGQNSDKSINTPIVDKIFDVTGDTSTI